MKKLIITLAVALVGTTTTFSQGTIDFAGSSAFPIKVATGFDAGSLAAAVKIGAANTTAVQIGAGGGQVTVELFVGTSTSSLILAGIITNTTSTVGAAQGSFVSQTSYVLGSGPGTSTATFSSAAFATGSVIDFQYYVFTANGLYQGYSPIETGYALGGGVTSPGATFGNGAGQVPGIVIGDVPEPSSIALSGLSAAALLLFRRRQ